MELNTRKKILNLANNFNRLAMLKFANIEYADVSSIEYGPKISMGYVSMMSIPDMLQNKIRPDIKIIDNNEDENELDSFYGDFRKSVNELAARALAYNNDNKGFDELLDSFNFIKSEYFAGQEDYENNYIEYFSYDNENSCFALDRDEEGEDYDKKITLLKQLFDSTFEYLNAVELMLSSKDLRESYDSLPDDEKKLDDNELNSLNKEVRDNYVNSASATSAEVYKRDIDVYNEQSVYESQFKDEDGKGSDSSIKTVTHKDRLIQLIDRLTSLKLNARTNIETSCLYLNNIGINLILKKGISSQDFGDFSEKNIKFIYENFNEIKKESQVFVKNNPSEEEIVLNLLKLLTLAVEQYFNIENNKKVIESKYKEIQKIQGTRSEILGDINKHIDKSYLKLQEELKIYRKQKQSITSSKYRINKLFENYKNQVEFKLKSETDNAVIERLKKDLNDKNIERNNKIKIENNKLERINQTINEINLNFKRENGALFGSSEYIKEKLINNKNKLEAEFKSTNDIVAKQTLSDQISSINSDLNNMSSEFEQYRNLVEEFNPIITKIVTTSVRAQREVFEKVSLHFSKNKNLTLDKASYDISKEAISINELLNSYKQNKISLDALKAALNGHKKNILDKSNAIRSLIISNLKLKKGVGYGKKFDKEMNIVNTRINSFNVDKIGLGDNLSSPEKAIESILNLNNLLVNKINETKTSSAYTSKSFVGKSEGLGTDLFTNIDKLQNQTSTKITNEFAYASIKNETFKKFVTSDSMKVQIQKIKKSTLSEHDSKSIESIKANAKAIYLFREIGLYADLEVFGSIKKEIKSESEKTIKIIKKVPTFQTQLPDIYKYIESDPIDLYNSTAGNSFNEKFANLLAKLNSVLVSGKTSKEIKVLIENFRNVFQLIEKYFILYNKIKDVLESNKDGSLNDLINKNQISEEIASNVRNLSNKLLNPNAPEPKSGTFFKQETETEIRTFWTKVRELSLIYINKYKSSNEIEEFINFYKRFKDLNTVIMSIKTLVSKVEKTYNISSETNFNAFNIKEYLKQSKFDPAILNKSISFQNFELSNFMGLDTIKINNLTLKTIKSKLDDLFKDLYVSKDDIKYGLIKYKVLAKSDSADTYTKLLENVVDMGILYLEKIQVYLDYLEENSVSANTIREKLFEEISSPRANIQDILQSAEGLSGSSKIMSDKDAKELFKEDIVQENEEDLINDDLDLSEFSNNPENEEDSINDDIDLSEFGNNPETIIGENPNPTNEEEFVEENAGEGFTDEEIYGE